MAMNRHNTMTEVRGMVESSTEGGLITVPITVAMREPDGFVFPVRLSFVADGERARTIQRLQHGMNCHNLRKGDGKHVASIASVVEYLLEQIAARYAAETDAEAADDGLRTYNIQLAVMEPPSGIRPVTVWYKGHGLRAKTLQRLLAGLNGCRVRRIGGKQIESHDAVVKYLFEQVQAALVEHFHS